MIKYGAVSKDADDSGRVQVVKVRMQSVKRDFWLCTLMDFCQRGQGVVVSDV